MINYSNDFLKALDDINLREQQVKLILLDWNENPICQIQGKATGGSVNINGQSSVRRTLNLTMRADDSNNNLTDLNNLFALNKKIIVQVGQKNYLQKYKEQYGETIWFQLGMFIIATASISASTSGVTINLTGKDKMVLLNGIAGGTLPASVTFHEKQIENSDGTIDIERPTIITIIREAVSQFGGELLNNIFINDLDENASLLVKYVGSSPIYLEKTNYSKLINKKPDPDIEGNYIKIIYGQDAGYFETSFTYPGELILSAGETVDSLLQKICQTLGNYEYFYDIDGHFIFQEKKNYINKYYFPLENIESPAPFIENQYAFIIDNDKRNTQVSQNPNYDNIKNDFIVWGVKTSVTNTKIGICYHLAIDDKPPRDLFNKYIYKVNNKIEISSDRPTSGIICSPINTTEYVWQEELYRRALIGANEETSWQAYDEELIGFWREVYDPNKEEWNNTGHWNPAKENDPAGLVYWLDFIDTNSYLGQYSIGAIGRRTKVVNNEKINSLFNTQVPDVTYLKTTATADKKAELQNKEQRFCVLTDIQYNTWFTNSSTGASAYDEIISLLGTHLIYNSTISITSVPKYYLEPNVLIYIYNEKTKINGDFVINSINLPLAYNGTMTINASQVLKKL